MRRSSSSLGEWGGGQTGRQGTSSRACLTPRTSPEIRVPGRRGARSPFSLFSTKPIIQHKAVPVPPGFKPLSGCPLLPRPCHPHRPHHSPLAACREALGTRSFFSFLCCPAPACPRATPDSVPWSSLLLRGQEKLSLLQGSDAPPPTKLGPHLSLRAARTFPS